MIDFLVNIQGKSAELYDDEDHSFSTFKTSIVGKAVAKGLSHYEETENQSVYVHDVIIAQNKLIALEEKPTGSKFDVETFRTADLESAAYLELGKEFSDSNL